MANNHAQTVKAQNLEAYTKSLKDEIQEQLKSLDAVVTERVGVQADLSSVKDQIFAAKKELALFLKETEDERKEHELQKVLIAKEWEEINLARLSIQEEKGLHDLYIKETSAALETKISTLTGDISLLQTKKVEEEAAQAEELREHSNTITDLRQSIKSLEEEKITLEAEIEIAEEACLEAKNALHSLQKAIHDEGVVLAQTQAQNADFLSNLERREREIQNSLADIAVWRHRLNKYYKQLYPDREIRI